MAHTYGDNGHVSVDPAILLKLMFLLFHENVRSERELVRRLPERLDWLWFLGYDLDDDAPTRLRFHPPEMSNTRRSRTALCST